MEKIKFLLMAFVAMTLSAGFVACSSDDDDNNTPAAQQSNFEKYMTAVENEVKAKKAQSGHKKALLLVAFGSTWENAHKTFREGIIKDYENDAAFKSEYDVYFAFTSAKCINRSREGEHYASRSTSSPVRSSCVCETPMSRTSRTTSTPTSTLNTSRTVSRSSSAVRSWSRKKMLSR